MADSGDGLPYESRSDTPDQQGAGVVNPPTMSPASLLEMLGSMGGAGAPQGGMAGAGSLIGMLPPPVSQASVYAQALSGGISAMRGTPDPVQAIVQNQQKQQMGVVDMLRKMGDSQRQAIQWGVTNTRLQKTADLNEAKFLHQKEQDAFTKTKEHQINMLKWNKELLDVAPTDAARATMATQRAKLMQGLMGVPVPEEVMQGWVSSQETDKEIKQIISGFRGAGDDPVLAQGVVEQFRLSPEKAAYYRTMSTKDAFLASNGFPTGAELDAQRADLTIKQADAARALLPVEYRNLPGTELRRVMAMSEEMFPGRDPSTLTRPEKAAVSKRYDLEQRQFDEEKLRMQSGLRLQHAVEMANQRAEHGLALHIAKLQATAARPLTTDQMRRELAPFDGASKAYRLVGQLGDTIERIPGDAFPKTDDAIAVLTAGVRRAFKYPGQVDVFTLKQQWLPVLQGALDRGFFDEKGTNSIKLAMEQIKALDNLPSQKTLKGYVERTQQLLRDEMESMLQRKIAQPGAHPDAVGAMKYIVGQVNPDSALVQPGVGGTSPLDPPMVKRRAKVIGKHLPHYGQEVEVEVRAGGKMPDGYVEIR